MHCHALAQVKHSNTIYWYLTLVFNVQRSEMTLNDQMIVERYPSSNEVVGGLIPNVKSSLYLTRGGGLVR